MRNFFILILGLATLNSISHADVNLPDRALRIKVIDIYTISGNIAENAVRESLANALNQHTLSSLSIRRVESNARVALIFDVRITENQVQDVIQGIFSQATGHSKQMIQITHY